MRTRPERAFREWTRGLSFTLTLGKSQVAALVSVHASKPGELLGCSHPRLSHFVTALRGLRDRGLVDHNGRHHTMTEPGRMVVELLKATGVYQELESEFRAFDEAQSARFKRLA